MGRKRNPVLPVFTRDILSSPRCRALSELAAGVYFFLLCRLNEPPQPGAYRLSDWELHPNWKRSKTQQCLAEADKYERLQYFAALLAKNDLPWRQKNILAGLQELYKYGIIVVEGDMLVQPRMYKDNGFTLPDLDHDGQPEGTILDDPASGSMASKDGEEFMENKGVQNSTEKRTENGTKKVQKKVPLSHAPAPANRDRERVNNNNNSNKRGVGENIDATDDFWQFWQQYDKKRVDNHWIGIDHVYKEWQTLTDTEKHDVLDFLPTYIDATPIKKWRMHPLNFLQQKAWHTIVIENGRVRQTAEDTTETPEETEIPKNTPVADTSATPAKPAARKRASPVSDNPPTLEDVQAYFDERREQGRPFLYITPDTFFDACEQSGWRLKDGKPMMDWRARVRTFENYRRDHGEQPLSARQRQQPKAGEAVRQTEGKDYNDW